MNIQRSDISQKAIYLSYAGYWSAKYMKDF